MSDIAGYIIAGPGKNDRIEADWDGAVHATREGGEAELRKCRRTYTDWDLYELRPLNVPTAEDHGESWA